MLWGAVEHTHTWWHAFASSLFDVGCVYHPNSFVAPSFCNITQLDWSTDLRQISYFNKLYVWVASLSPQPLQGVIKKLGPGNFRPTGQRKCISIWMFPKIGVPQNRWFIMENPIKMDDLEVPLFSETSISAYPCNVGGTDIFFLFEVSFDDLFVSKHPVWLFQWGFMQRHGYKLCGNFSVTWMKLKSIWKRTDNQRFAASSIGLQVLHPLLVRLHEWSCWWQRFQAAAKGLYRYPSIPFPSISTSEIRQSL